MAGRAQPMPFKNFTNTLHAVATTVIQYRSIIVHFLATLDDVYDFLLNFFLYVSLHLAHSLLIFHSKHVDDIAK